MTYQKRFYDLTLGLILFALGSVITMKANLGFTPWNCFHQGLANIFHISIGSAANITGCIIFIWNALLHEKIGIGTIGNMLVVGWIMDIILWMNLIPTIHTLYLKFIFLLLGMMVLALGSYYYMSSGFGAGPRDNLLVMLSRKTKLKSGYCSILIETFVTIVGFFMGGPLGIGTLLGAIGQGACIQFVFEKKKYHPVNTKNETIKETMDKVLRGNQNKYSRF